MEGKNKVAGKANVTSEDIKPASKGLNPLSISIREAILKRREP
jgi:hypothetical protein